MHFGQVDFVNHSHHLDQRTFVLACTTFFKVMSAAHLQLFPLSQKQNNNDNDWIISLAKIS